MSTIILEGDIEIPDGIDSIDDFRDWAASDRFPERGHFCWLKNRLWVDLTMEQVFTHNQIKAEAAEVVRPLVKAERKGYYLVDGVLLTNSDVDLSTGPDGLFVSYATLLEAKARLIEGKKGGYVEVVGTPDMSLEVVSDSSEKKDTVILRKLYWEAGIPEYWLIDARGKTIQFDILRWTARGYVATRKLDGWLTSRVFARSFRFVDETDALGNRLYTLSVRA